MAAPKYRKPPQYPPLFTHTPESILSETKRLNDQSKALQDRVVGLAGSATFDNILRPLAQNDDQQALEAFVLGFYQAVSTDSKLRDASVEGEKLMNDFAIESSMREDLFKVVDEVFQKQKDDRDLDAESRRLLDKERQGYIQMGLGIKEKKDRDRFKEIKKRLSELGITFQKNLNEEQSGIWFTPEQLEGVPKDVLATLKNGDKGTENEGKLWVTFKYPDLLPSLSYGKDPETRQKLFIANENKCNQNAELFKETIVLRDEAARLLGYPNHAAARIEDKMAKTPKTVDDFLSDLRTRLAPGGERELDMLKELKKNETGNGEKYFLWDHRFYDNLMTERDYSLDKELIKEWFPLSVSIMGMLSIFEELFGLVFVKIEGKDRDLISETGKGEDIVWHQDVQLFSVWDDEGEGSGFVGYLYLDLHPRDGKYGHAANFNLQPGFTAENGTRRYPATALVCNFSKPTPTKPSLLKHDEVVTLFHELGHGIHDLVARTTYSRFHGTNTVRDFVEAPSQMLENWCWTSSQLKSLSKHWSYLSPEYFKAWQASVKEGEQRPEEHLPATLIENIINSRHVNDAMHNLRQLHFGIFDMTVHEPKSHDEIKALDAQELYNKLREDICHYDGPGGKDSYHWGNGQATFGHLIGGYDAGYYGYLFSQVYSTDMFYSVFRENPMDGKAGRKYRHTVLEKGGSQDEMKSLEDFLGRRPSAEAFYKELGLA